MAAFPTDPEQPPERARRAANYLSAEYNLSGQQQWYDDKASFNKRWHVRLGLVTIAAGAATTVVQLWAPSSAGAPVHWSTWLTAFLGALVILAKGVDRLWNFDENWVTYRQASEAIKRERRLYINGAGPYRAAPDEDAAYRLFIERVEEIVAAEEQTYWQYNRQSAEEQEAASRVKGAGGEKGTSKKA